MENVAYLFYKKEWLKASFSAIFPTVMIIHYFVPMHTLNIFDHMTFVALVYCVLYLFIRWWFDVPAPLSMHS